jgi:hypothetical protein
VTTGVHPIAEPHEHLLGATCSVALPQFRRQQRRKRRLGVTGRPRLPRRSVLGTREGGEGARPQAPVR